MPIDEKVMDLSDRVRAMPPLDDAVVAQLRAHGLMWVYEQAQADRHLPMNDASRKSLEAILGSV